jgi:single-strand DNA-binding protein
MRSNKSTDSTNSPATEPAEQKSRGDSVNQVTLIGRLVAAPELRETGSGKHVTTIRVATNGKTHTEFHSVVLWAQLADFATSYLGKGRLVYVEGRLQSRTWQASDGSSRRNVEIIANRLQALSSKSASEAPAA